MTYGCASIDIQVGWQTPGGCRRAWLDQRICQTCGGLRLPYCGFIGSSSLSMARS